MADLSQLIYHSQPFGYDAPTLSNILLDARRCNDRDGITGALVCRHDIYLQLLEGPTAQVEAAYARILEDDRHAGVTQLVKRPIATRTFADWAMLHDPAQSWMWSRAEMAEGALDQASATDVIGIFETLRDKVKQAPAA